MMTVVDQVRPWFTPSSTLAKMIQPHDGAHIRMNGTGRPISQPATSTGLRPTRSESVPAKKLVAAFTTPKATMNVSAGGEGGEPEDFVGEQGQDGALLADHPADERVDATSSANCGRFSRSPSWTCVCRARRAGHGPVASARPVTAAQSSGPPTSTDRSSMSSAFEQARARHRALAVPTHHGEVARRAGRRRAPARRARRCARRARGRRRTRRAGGRRARVPLTCAGRERARSHVTARPARGPGRESAVELAGEVFVADGEALTDEFVAVLVVVEDEDDRT